MSENIELKHLASYLQYELKMQVPDNYRFDGMKTDAKQLLLTGIWNNHVKLSDISGFYPMVHFKPILRPLSVDYENEISEDDLQATSCNSRLRLIAMAKTNGLYHFQFEYLVSQLFDVFDLINKGLAINKLTL